MTQSLLLIAGSFLVGSLPFSFWVARSFAGLDLRTTGSGNPGATNVLRVAGKRPAVLALVLDIAKGVLPVVTALVLGESETVVAAVAVAAMLGHVVSPFLGLRGGKGVATSIGALTILNPYASIGGIVAFVVVVYWKRYVSLGSTVGATVIAVLALLSEDVGVAGLPGAAATCIIAALVVVRHLRNITRLVRGIEPRLGEEVSEV